MPKSLQLSRQAGPAFDGGSGKLRSLRSRESCGDFAVEPWAVQLFLQPCSLGSGIATKSWLKKKERIYMFLRGQLPPAQVFVKSFWMCHFGARTPKRTTVMSNSKFIELLDLGKLTKSKRPEKKSDTTRLPAIWENDFRAIAFWKRASSQFSPNSQPISQDSTLTNQAENGLLEPPS